MGLLQVAGTLDTDQFWPKGSSDADTTKVVVDIGENAFRFQPHPDAPFTVTNVFQAAKVRVRVTAVNNIGESLASEVVEQLVP